MRLAEFAVDGIKYELGYDFNGLVDAEEETRCNLLVALNGLAGGLSATELRGLLYAMIVPWPEFPKNAQERLKAVGSLIRIDTIGAIYAALGEACALAVSEEYAKQYRAKMGPEPEAPAAEAPEMAATRHSSIPGVAVLEIAV